jgi:hypothetical protein
MSERSQVLPVETWFDGDYERGFDLMSPFAYHTYEMGPGGQPVAAEAGFPLDPNNMPVPLAAQPDIQEGVLYLRNLKPGGRPNNFTMRFLLTEGNRGSDFDNPDREEWWYENIVAEAPLTVAGLSRSLAVYHPDELWVPRSAAPAENTYKDRLFTASDDNRMPLAYCDMPVDPLGRPEGATANLIDAVKQEALRAGKGVPLLAADVVYLHNLQLAQAARIGLALKRHDPEGEFRALNIVLPAVEGYDLIRKMEIMAPHTKMEMEFVTPAAESDEAIVYQMCMEQGRLPAKLFRQS